MPAQTVAQERTFLRIEGDIAELITEHITKQVPVNQLQQALVDMMPKQGTEISTPALPVGTRFFVRKGGYEYYVIEQPPTKRVMVTGGDSTPGWFKGKKTKLYAMPYVIFVIQVPEGATQVTPGFRVFFAQEPLNSMDDTLLIAPLPNLDNRGTICVGSTPAAVGISTRYAIEEVIANFWGSQFRYGGQSIVPNGVFPPGKRPGLFDNWGSHSDGGDFKKWSEDTKAAVNNDTIGLTLYPWETSDHTVREAIENPQKGI